MYFDQKEVKTLSHENVPPCNCNMCQELTKEADAKRAELFTILSRMAPSKFAYSHASGVLPR